MPPRAVSLEAYPRWVRGRLRGETVVDSRRASLRYEAARTLPERPQTQWSR